MKKNESSIFSKNLGLLKDHLQETKKIKGVIDLAEKLGTNRNSLRWYLNGEQQPGLGFLLNLSKCFDVNFEWLLENRGSMFRNEDLENTYKVLMDSPESQRSIMVAKLKFYPLEEQEIEQMKANLSTLDLADNTRQKLESRCIGQILILQRQRQKLEISQDIIFEKDGFMLRSEITENFKKDINKQILEISKRIVKFSLRNSVEYKALQDEIVGKI